jgi:hypothetical protein
MQKKAAGNPFGADEAENDDPPAVDEAANAPGAGTGSGSGQGAVIATPKGGFEAAMALGAIPPTEVIFTAAVSVGDKVEKLDRDAPVPLGNFLTADYKTKPFRTYAVQIRADAHALRLTQTADGVRHGKVQFVTLVFDQEGRQVNSLMSSASVDVAKENYPQLLIGGMRVRQEIAVPVKGNFFLRIGVHDLGSDHIGAMEIPVDAVHAGGTSAELGKP